MLPYFNADRYFLYAKSSHLYLQDMLAMKESTDQLTLHRFQDGFITVMQSNKLNNGIWINMIIEQTLMKSIKMEGVFLLEGAQRKVFYRSKCTICIP